MMRHSLLDKLGGYAEWPEYAEDYELWTRVVQQSKLANVPDKLFKLRRHKRSVTVSKRERQIHTCGAIAAKLHKALLGQQVAEKIPEFLVWMEAVGVKRAVRETGVENMTTVHRYTRALYESCARQLLSEGSNVRVRQQALPKLDAIANLIYEREGWVQGALHKLKARFMSPAHEIFPWILRAMRHRIY